MKHIVFGPADLDEETLHRQGLRIGPDRGIPVFNGALVMTMREHQRLQRANMAVSRCLEIASDYILKQMPGVLAAACSHSDKKVRLVRADPSTRLPWAAAARLDTVWENGIPRVLEYNSGMPEGWSYVHLLQTASRKPAWHHLWFAAKPSPSPLPLLWDAMEALFKERFGRREVPVCAFLYYPMDSVKSVETPVFAEFVRLKGYEVMEAEPGELELRERRVYLRGRRVNLVFKCFGTRDCPEAVERLCLKPSGYECIAVPHPRQTIMGLKYMMALLSDPAYTGLYRQPDVQVLRQVMPWTRVVANSTTTDQTGLTVDLVDFISKGSSTLVLKESSGSSGKAVVLGWSTSGEEWEKTLRQALNEGSWIVQERVSIPKSEFDGVEASWDCDPYFFLGQVGPVVSRFSQSDILNVFQGGALCPVLVRVF